MLEIWDITSKDPYNEIADIVEQWARKNYYTDFIVSIVIDGELTTELLLVDQSINFEWLNDWWEGQKKIKLVGFVPADQVVVLGEPQADRKYSYFLTDSDIEEVANR